MVGVEAIVKVTLLEEVNSKIKTREGRFSTKLQLTC